MIDVETARCYYTDNDAAHSFEHVLRVWHLAARIGRAEGADLEILRGAALLHDVGRGAQSRNGRCHAEVGAELARVILSDESPAQVEAVALAIAEHRFRGHAIPSTIEAQVLYDADKLDAIGAIGIARAYAIAGARRQRLWAEVEPCHAERSPVEGKKDLDAEEHTPVHEYLFKLSKLAARMCTATGRRLAQERHAYMVGFFERLAREVVGEI
jgi:uncharacterized protein